MLLAKYGDFEFKYNGETFTGKCSFGNLTKLGTPKDIIYYATLIHHYDDEIRYVASRRVLQCFIDKQLPEFNDFFFMPDLDFRGNPTSEPIIDSKQDERTWIEVMAKHCIHHAMTGKVKEGKSSAKSESVTEFDPYEFIESAMELLELTKDEAANLSMTEYIARIEAKPWYKEAMKKEGGKLTLKQQKDLLDEQREMDKKLKARN